MNSELQNYLSLSAAEKLAYARSLGIAGAGLVDVSAAEAQTILSWLNGRSLHFGQSAYIVLETLLANAGLKNFSRVQLAAELILTDILTGTITPLESGDLVISLYAMKRFAGRQGLETTALALDYDTLKSLCHPEPPAHQIIAHINGNHYIVITNVTDTEVTYMDPGLGAEGAHPALTMTKEQFLLVWQNPAIAGPNQGVILAPSVMLAPSVILSAAKDLKATELSASQQMAVRGAFFFFLIPLFVAIATAIAHAVAAVVSAVVALIGSVISGIGSVLSGFGQIFGGLFSGNFVAGLQAGFGSVLNGLGTIASGLGTFLTSFQGALIGGIKGIADAAFFYGGAMLSSAFSSSALANALGAGMIGLGLQGTGVLLEKIGVSPKVAQTLIAGGKIAIGVGLLATGNPLGLAASLGFVSGGTSEFLALHTNLSPTILNLVSVGASALGAFAGGILGGGGLTQGLASLKLSLPYLSMDLASAGISAVGNALGLSPIVSSLISIPVSVAAGSITHGAINTGATILSSLKDNFLKNTMGGLVSLGSTIALDKLGVPANANQFISGYLGQIFSGAPSRQTEGGQAGGIFKMIGDGIRQFGQGIASAAGSVISFGQKVLQQTGTFTASAFKQTLGTFSALFGRQTQEAIYQDLTGLRQGTVTAGGGLWTWQSGSNVVQYDSNSDQFRVLGADIQVEINGAGEVSTGGLSYQALTYSQVSQEGFSLKQDFKSGTLQDAGYYYHGELLTDIKVPDWRYQDAWLKSSNVEIPTWIDIPGPTPESKSTPTPVWFTFNIQDNKIVSSTAQIIKSETSAASRLDKELFVLANGINNPNPSGAPSYMGNLKFDLFEQSVFANEPVDPSRDILVVPAYVPDSDFEKALAALLGPAQTKIVMQQMLDLKKVWDTQVSNAATETEKIRGAIDSFFMMQSNEEKNRQIVGVGYSGGLHALVDAIAGGGYNAKAFVALGAPLFALGAKFAEAIVNLVQAYENMITLRDPATRLATQTAVSIFEQVLEEEPGVGLFLKGADLILSQLDSLYETIDKQKLDEFMADLYKQLRAAVEPFTLFNWTSVNTSKPELMVNIWGSDDPIAKGNILGGYVDHIGQYSITDRDKPLFNIEIEGADHFDYIRGVKDYSDIEDPIERAQAVARNEAISKFVAQLILNSQDPDQFRSFMARQKLENVAIPNGDNTWKIYL